MKNIHSSYRFTFISLILYYIIQKLSYPKIIKQTLTNAHKLTKFPKWQKYFSMFRMAKLRQIHILKLNIFSKKHH